MSRVITYYILTKSRMINLNLNSSIVFVLKLYFILMQPERVTIIIVIYDSGVYTAI